MGRTGEKRFSWWAEETVGAIKYTEIEEERETVSFDWNTQRSIQAHG